MGYTNCTKVQAETLPATLQGLDVVCKAKTGTGKTLAFLIPGIERVRIRILFSCDAICIEGEDTICEGRQKPSQCLNKVLCNLQMLEAPAGRDKIAMLVISPTRELAAQIAEEAKQLTKHQNLGVQVETAQQNFQGGICTFPTTFSNIFAQSLCHMMCTRRYSIQERSKTCFAPGMAGDVWRHKYEP